jgi:hypothetical protein
VKFRQQGHRRATCSWPISSVSPASPPRDGCPYRSAQLPGTAQREVNHDTSHARALPNSVEGEFAQWRSTNQSGSWRARGGVEDAVRTVHCEAGQYLSPKIACAPGWAAPTAGLQVPCAPAPTAHPHNEMLSMAWARLVRTLANKAPQYKSTLAPNKQCGAPTARGTRCYLASEMELARPVSNAPAHCSVTEEGGRIGCKQAGSTLPQSVGGEERDYSLTGAAGAASSASAA